MKAGLGLLAGLLGAGAVLAEPGAVMPVYPLPGGLDPLPMFNDNSPESVPGSGILLSTLPGKPGSPFLDYAFNGTFGLFSHHLFIDRVAGTRLLYLGLIASNYGNRPVQLTLSQGASYLSQPDAPFSRRLPSLSDNAAADQFIGPGDRIATELIAGKFQLQDVRYTVPPGSSRILYSLPVHTDVAELAPQKDGTQLAVNGRSTLMRWQSDGPVYLSSLAWVARRDGEALVPPSLDDYRSLLNAGKFAGKHEPTSLYDAAQPPKGVFYYGRVAGVSPGLSWSGRLWEGARASERPGPGQAVGYPLATTYVKRFGTGQNQSGAMLRRYADSPPENHGNYGLHYVLELPFVNPDPRPRRYALRLSEPLNPNAAAGTPLKYAEALIPVAMFRGTLRWSYTDQAGQLQQGFSHLNLHNGERPEPFAELEVPALGQRLLKLELIYPADATPPQLLSIEGLIPAE